MFWHWSVSCFVTEGRGRERNGRSVTKSCQSRHDDVTTASPLAVVWRHPQAPTASNQSLRFGQRLSDAIFRAKPSKCKTKNSAKNFKSSVKCRTKHFWPCACRFQSCFKRQPSTRSKNVQLHTAARDKTFVFRIFSVNKDNVWMILSEPFVYGSKIFVSKLLFSLFTIDLLKLVNKSSANVL